MANFRTTRRRVIGRGRRPADALIKCRNRLWIRGVLARSGLSQHELDKLIARQIGVRTFAKSRFTKRVLQGASATFGFGSPSLEAIVEAMEQAPGFQGTSLPFTSHLWDLLLGALPAGFCVSDRADRVARRLGFERRDWRSTVAAELLQRTTEHQGRDIREVFERLYGRALVRTLRQSGNVIARLELAALLFVEALAIDDLRRADQIRALSDWALRRSRGPGSAHIRVARDELLDTAFSARGMHRLAIAEVVADPERSATILMTPVEIETTDTALREAERRQLAAWERLGSGPRQTRSLRLELPQATWW